jgi:hypothetical protein
MMIKDYEAGRYQPSKEVPEGEALDHHPYDGDWKGPAE